MSTWCGRPSPSPPWRVRPSTVCWRCSSAVSPSGTLPTEADEHLMKHNPNESKQEAHMTMKTLTGAVAAAALFALASNAAQAADALTLQLKWVTQSQFAGYYVAK